MAPPARCTDAVLAKEKTLSLHPFRPTPLALSAGMACTLVCSPSLASGTSKQSDAEPLLAATRAVSPSSFTKRRLGFIVQGVSQTQANHVAVASAGDVNGDGLADLVIGAHFAKTAAGVISGVAYVVFGKTDTDVVDVTQIVAGQGGFVINGLAAGEEAGGSVGMAGDVNGDGLADLIIGAPDGDPEALTDSGRSYVVFGKASTEPVELTDVAAGRGGFVITGESFGARSGNSVAGAGDVNGDGLADLVIGAVNTRPGYYSYHGKSYVVFGKTSGTPVALSAVNAGQGGFVVDGQDGTDFGASVAGAGDVNGDGLADVVIGASAYQGRAYVVFGKTDTGALSAGGLYRGQGGFLMYGAQSYSLAGVSVAGAGDVNGDGLADVIVGAPSSEVLGVRGVGRSYVVFGKTSTARIQLLDIESGRGGFAISGESTLGSSGYSVAAAGDLNGDGLSDLLVGAPSATWGGKTYAGRIYVVFGKTDGTLVALDDVAAGRGGLAIGGPISEGQCGQSVAAGGDINGDGLPDLVIGAYDLNQRQSGAAYVVLGSTAGGYSLVERTGGSGDNTLLGTPAANSFAGGAGNDTLIGRGGADVLNGGSGDDRIVLDARNIAALRAGPAEGRLARVDGGSGLDTLAVSGQGVLLDLRRFTRAGAGTVSGASRLTSIERIDLTGSGDNDLIFGPSELRDMAGMNLINSASQAALGWSNGTYVFPAIVRRHQVIIDGDVGDRATAAASEWTFRGTAFKGSVAYSVFNSRSARVQVLLNTAVRLVLPETHASPTPASARRPV